VYCGLRPQADDVGARPAYLAGMGTKSRSAVWLSALGIGLFQVVGSFGAADNQPDRRAIDLLAVVLVLVGPVALAGRDRWPLGAVAATIGSAVVYVGLGYPYGPIFVGVVVALFAAVQAGHRRATWALAAAGFVGFVVAHLLDPRAEGGPEVVHLVLVAGWLVVVLAVSEVVRVQRQRAADLERAAHEERQRRIGEQRLRLAQELHDVLAHNISLINVQASVALHLMDEEPEQARPALATIKEASREALHELRTALDLLRRGDGAGEGRGGGGGDGGGGGQAAPRAPEPRLSDLDALVAGVRAGGLDVRVEGGSPPSPLPAAVELAAYRIVQEALTNVTRHARARSATVRLTYGDGVTVEVLDDGVGGPTDAGNIDQGNGILGMRERAAALGGSVEVGPRPGGGFRVAAHLPARQP
jgi:signal transduction histidine kinase